MKRSLLAACVLLVALAARVHAADAVFPTGAAAALDRIYDAIWQRWLREDPLLATTVGDARYDDRWPDLSLTAIRAAVAADQADRAALAAASTAGLSAADRLNLDIIEMVLARRAALAPHEPYLYAISHLGSLQNAGNLPAANEIAEIAPFATVKEYENWIARLKAFGRYADQVQALLAQGVRENRTQPKVIMQRVVPQLAAQRVASADQSPFYAPFRHFPDGFSAAQRARLEAAGRAAILDTVLPAFTRFERFFTGTYLPACRDTVGLSAVPDGAAYYRALIAYHTTTQLSAEEIHRIGLKEVARIRAEMDKVIEALGYRGSFQDFAHELRTDPKFFYTDPKELLHGYMVIAKSIDPMLVTLFGKLPHTPYGVRPVPELSAPDTATAYYQPPAADGSRPGYFYVNLYRPEARPKWEMEVLTAHEAVPGHHLQLALQYENAAGVPMIRRMAEFTAYVEGWALYAESLGEQLGLYGDPYQKFGQLTYDMWRAVRLVVDTGMHAMGWSRQQAVDYFQANAPKSELDIANEIDRYIAMPGQALAYKLGQLKILELRAAANEALGEKFDIREFHDTVLSTGAVPLPVMERTVRDWIAAKSAGAASPSKASAGSH